MLVIASRGSQLAMWQANWVASELRARGQECRIEIDKTTGDTITDVPLAKVGTKGLFTKEIEEALLDGTADLQTSYYYRILILPGNRFPSLLRADGLFGRA